MWRLLNPLTPTHNMGSGVEVRPSLPPHYIKEKNDQENNAMHTIGPLSPESMGLLISGLSTG